MRKQIKNATFGIDNKMMWMFFLVGFSLGLFMVVKTLVLAKSKKHDFTGQCALCHSEIPPEGTPFKEVLLKDKPERLCAHCHDISLSTSHPINVWPEKSMPLQQYLDPVQGMTCLTCHDVHKEEKISQRSEDVRGLLRGHAQGRSFCFICHNEKDLGAQWRHSLVITYAHLNGKFTQKSQGSFLDEHSTECLSCHDGTISKMSDVKVREGDFQHSIGLSHPIGVVYPRVSARNDYVDADALPKEIQLFAGKVGCLSCHNPYGGRKKLLVMENKRSALCLSCHIK